MSDAPRWPGADGSPGLDFSTEHGMGGAGNIYRESGGVGGLPVAVTSPNEKAEESASESTTVSGPKAKTQSAAEWATRPLGTVVPPPARPASAGAPGVTTAASAASAPILPQSAESANPAQRATRVGSRRTRKARLRLARIDPWSVMKTTFLFSIAFGVMLIVVVSVLWSVIAASGALEALNEFMTTLVGDQTGGEFRIETYISGSRVLGFAAVLAAIDVVIITAVSTLFAFLYNLAATIMGGLEVTLAED
ncbi:DUF3566 domain-containing protein [Tessaracoccus sp.]